MLVSEIMLQQTTVEVVIPYFERFMRRFPDAQALAASKEEELLGMWAGLGYYRRARSLRAAARAIVDRHGGRVPQGRDELLALPGIGPYTASAIMAIAHGAGEIALDGNLRRVLGRLVGYEGDPATAEGTAVLTAAGAGLLEGADPSVINQALMDLGASLCSVRAPRCLLCPLGEHCAARREGRAERIPPPRRRVAPVAVLLAAAILRKGRRLLMRRRGGAIMPGMWDFPMVEVSRGAAPGPEPGAEEALRHELERAGLGVAGLSAGRELRHTITNHRIRVRIFEGRCTGSLAGTQSSIPRPDARHGGAADIAGSEAGELRWVAEQDLAELPLTGMAAKIAAGLASPPEAPRSGKGRRRISSRG